MTTSKKRLSITLSPDWEPMMERLKKEKFYNKSFAEMLRHIIELGLKQIDTKPKSK